MNRGLLLKSFRETWATTLLFALALGIVETLLAFVIPKFQLQFAEQFERMQFMQTMIKALVGADVADKMGPELFQSLAWVHPVVLALVWAQAIISCTRFPAGEIERGTIDVMLGLPASRWSIYRCEAAICLTAGFLVLAMGCLGAILGGRTAPIETRIEPYRLIIVTANLACLYISVAGFTSLISAISNRRGRAGMIALIVVLGSFLLNYLAQFWNPAKSIVFVSIVNYYRPISALHGGVWPLRDMAVLAGVGIICWAIGGVLLSRRDLTTT